MKARPRSTHAGMLPKLRIQADDGFRCQHCGAFVTSAVGFSGVGNRNHCPYCLWSRHLDLYRGGDRLSACKAPMRPVGLTHKRSAKKYAGSSPGELMLVHHCTGCGGLSINRLAADDDPTELLAVCTAVAQLTPALHAAIQASQIEMLEGDFRARVEMQLVAEIELEK